MVPLDFIRDFAGFIQLSRQIYGDKTVSDERLYRWLFLNNPYNPLQKHFLHIAKDGDKVIASDGLVPIPLIVGGKEYLAAWSVKTMTHPAYQRQGLFKRLTEFSIARAKDSGLQLLLGFANNQSFPGYEKFGWNNLLERQAVLRPVDLKAALVKRLRIKILGQVGGNVFRGWDKRRIARLARRYDSLETTILTTAPASLDGIWLRMKTAYPVLVKRDHRYVNWRYNQRPDQDYKFLVALAGGEPLGMLVFRETNRKTCLLVDYIGAPTAPVLPVLILRTINYCRERALRYIISSSGANFDDGLKEFGFRLLTTPLANNRLISRPLTALNLQPLEIDTNWFFSYGDSEFDLDLPPQTKL